MAGSTINSTIKGKAYEYACIFVFQEIVSATRIVETIDNSSLRIAKQRFDEIAEKEQNEMLSSARAGIKTIIKMEPKIIEDGKDKLTISLQPDDVAKSGDVRDVLVIRRSINWEIGISVKHNHAALKHSRLSTCLDFGNAWFGVKCSSQYFADINPIFSMLSEKRQEGKKWSELSNKEVNVYIPILTAFKNEFERICHCDDEIVKELIKYLLGSNGKDYYKLIHNRNHTATVMPFNLYGTLNTTANKKPEIVVPSIEFPTRIIEFTFKDNSKTTLILTLNNGWSISFRIHNASSRVEPSLKFDIQLQSKPENMFYIDVLW